MTIRPTRWWFTAITITGRFYIMFAVILLCVAGVVFGALRTTELRSEASADLARAAAVQRSLDRALTVLTSMNQASLRETGVVIDLMDQVLRLAELTREAGLDGVVASPRETAAIRSRCGAGFTIVTPGIRGGAASSSKDDQERTMSPEQAVAAGASYLVVGRPIIGAADPRQAADAIAGSLQGIGG